MRIPIAVLMVVALLSPVYYVYGTSETETVAVEDTFYRVSDGKQIYMVEFSDGRTMRVSDSLLRGHFSSTDDWRALRAGESVEVSYYGWRIPVLSVFPNVYRVNP